MATAAQKLDELMAKMVDPTSDNIERKDNVTGMIYGDNGCGKTVTALKLAQAILEWKGGGRILHVDAVNALRSVKNHPELQPNVKRLPYEGKEQVATINEALKWKPNKFFEDVKVVIFDELSSMLDHDGDVVLAARSAADSTKDPDVLTQPDMGVTTERMRRVFINTLKQDVSVIFVSHIREDEDKLRGYRITRPGLMPKFSRTIREGLDFVVFMSAKEAGQEDGALTYVRVVQPHPTRTIVAKSRVGGLKTEETPETFVAGVMRWLKGEIGDHVETNVINDIIPDVSEELTDDDFVGVTVN